MAKDPVCGMEVEEDEAAAQREHKDQTYYFCSVGCQEEFDRDPEQYGKQEKKQKREGKTYTGRQSK